MSKVNGQMKTRVVLCVLGVMICGIAVGFFKFACFGVDPFTSFMCGLDKTIPLSYGLLYIIANALLLIFSLVFDRHYVGLGTIINLFLVGYLAQFTEFALGKVLPADSIVVRIICLIIGVVALSFSAGLYMPADLGVSTYDAVALIIANTWHKGQFKYDRIITDLVCVAIGVTLYLIAGESFKSITAIVSIGTIITAFLMGPLVDFFSNKFTKRFFLKG
ncbi:MAG: hypothetical protein K6C38_05535 [Saccharofermentans sp.]|nr:hypothetical protein [Saccharofermentans sp.]